MHTKKTKTRKIIERVWITIYIHEIHVKGMNSTIIRSYESKFYQILFYYDDLSTKQKQKLKNYICKF
jgi:hypothetical protein